MRIGYMTTDDVNHSLAEELAADCGAQIYLICPGEQCPPDGYAAVLFDLDAVPWALRHALLGDIVSGTCVYPKGVHGYDLEEKQARMLQLNGVAVAQRLQAKLIDTLYRAALRRLPRVPPDDALLDATWIGAPTSAEQKQKNIVLPPPLGVPSRR